MIHRRGMLAAAVAALAGAGPWATARAAGRGAFRPRDLEGVWSTASYTELERPAGLTRLVLTPQEAQAYEAPRRALGGIIPGRGDRDIGQEENEYIERGDGLARVKGQIRSSWIVDPPDGRIPYDMAALARVGLEKNPPPEHGDNPEEMSGPERCLTSYAGAAPMVAGPDCNVFQVVQSPGHVVFLSEKYHDARIVRLGGAPRPSPLPRSWLGDSVGWWEGDALVVETLGLRPGVTNRGYHVYVSGTTRVVERFTRTAPDELAYEFTVEDPALYTRPWRAEMALHPAKGRIYEYACHEGNYSLPNIMAGARLAEREGGGER